MLKAHTLATLMLLAIGCAGRQAIAVKPIQAVPAVDMNRFVGTWHEIATIPQPFEKDCYAADTEYSLRDDGQLDVLSRCTTGGPGGPEITAHGLARILDRSSNSKLEQTFSGPFWSDRSIIDLGDEYEFAVVGNARRDSLSVLSRSAQLDGFTYLRILGRAAKQGFDVSRLRRTPQSESRAVRGG